LSYEHLLSWQCPLVYLATSSRKTNFVNTFYKQQIKNNNTT